MDYINSQHHQVEDMNNALQAYNVMTSPTSDVTLHQSINSVHIHLFYHVAQSKQAQHGSLVDRGANGGLAGVRCQSPLQILKGMHCYWYCPTPDQWPGYCAMCCVGQHQPWVCQPHHE